MSGRSKSYMQPNANYTGWQSRLGQTTARLRGVTFSQPARVAALCVLAISIVGGIAHAADMWSDLAPGGPLPDGRYYHTSIYDPVRHQMVTFGGWTAAYAHGSDTWVVNLTGTPQWTPLAPTGELPQARAAHSAVYDPVRQRMVIFGGGSDTGRLNDVWALSLENTPTWARVNPQGEQVPALAHHLAIYDPIGDRMVAFGGTTAGGIPSNETWALQLSDPPTWSRLTPSGDYPAPRAGAAGIYDAVNRRLLVFGGAFETGCFNDTWALSLDGAPVWTEVQASNPPVVNYTHTAIYDAARERMVIFAGHDCQVNQELNGTWVLPLNGAPVWTELAPEGSLPPRLSGASAVYDWGSNRMVVFGGNPGFSNGLYALSFDAIPWQRIWLLAGSTLNGQPVDGVNNTVSVQPGNPLRGDLRIQHDNDNCTAIVPLVYTPTWGDHETSWRSVSGSDSCGSTVHDVPINLTAPTVPGTYFLVFTSAAQISGEYIASMTSWICGAPVWNDGNDLADLREPDLIDSRDRGYAWLPGWECDRLQNWVHGVTYVKVLVDTAVDVLALSGLETLAEEAAIRIRWHVHDPRFVGFLIERAEGENPRASDYDVLNSGEPVSAHGPWEYLDTAVVGGGVYSYGILALGTDGTVQRFGPIAARASSPSQIRLYPSFPNPVVAAASLRFAIPNRSEVSLRLYDASGRNVRSLWDGPAAPGVTDVVWDGLDDLGYPAPAGVYMARLVSGSHVTSQRVVVVR